MDSSKRKAGEMIEEVNKRARIIEPESLNQVDENIANGTPTQDGSNESERPPQQPRVLLKDLVPDVICKIVKKVSMMDHLSLLSAFASDPSQDYANIREGIALNLRGQRALYLQVDQGEYDVNYQYNFNLENILSNAFLPELDGLPISSEQLKHISLPKLRKIGILSSFRRLKQIFPNLLELKLVLRNFSPVRLKKLAKIVKVFSKQLTSLQLLIFGDNSQDLTSEKFIQFVLHLNDCNFDRLRHFTLVWNGEEKMFTTDTEKEYLIPLTLLSTVEECYLRLPWAMIQHQKRLLEANERLIRLGLIAYTCEKESGTRLVRRFVYMSPELVAKIVHLETPGYLQPIPDSQIPHCTSLTTVRLYRLGFVNSDKLHVLAQSGNLQQLEISLNLYINLQYFEVLGRQHWLTPVFSVTHLKVRVAGLLDHSHFSIHLRLDQWFPNLRELSVEFYHYSCSQCSSPHNRRTQADLGACQQAAVRPLIQSLFNLVRCDVLDRNGEAYNFFKHR